MSMGVIETIAITRTTVSGAVYTRVFIALPPDS